MPIFRKWVLLLKMLMFFLIFINILADGKIVLYRAQYPGSTDKPTPYWQNTD